MSEDPIVTYPDLADGQLQRHFDRGILTLTINRPEKANALSTPILEAIVETFQIAEEDPETKAIVITGSGDRVFSGGADLKEMEATENDPGFLEEYFGLWEKTTKAVESFPLPTIALINGACVAGGLSLALACDIRIATENAFLSYPRIADGHLPGRHNLTHLARLVGQSRTALVMLCGFRVYASEAQQWGMVDTLLEGAHSTRDLARILDTLRGSDRNLMASAKYLIAHADEDAAWEQINNPSS